MQFTSSAFKNGERIPPQYTCDGKNMSPPLEIADVPDKAKSLVIIMDDPDVPPSVREDRMWVHWVVYNIPATVKNIAENSVPPGVMGKGTGNKLAYQGPCPPDREHRYFFKLYALDTLLSLKEGATKEQVEEAMKGHILGRIDLMGRYERIRK